MTESNSLNPEEQLTEMIDLCEKQQDEIESLKAQLKQSEEEKQQLNDLVLELSEADTMLNEAQMIQEQNAEDKAQLQLDAASNKKEAASLSKEKKEWEAGKAIREEWDKKVADQDAKTKQTLKEEREAMDKEDERRQKSFNKRLKAATKKKVIGFRASYIAVIVYSVALSIYVYIRSGGYKHFLSFFEFFIEKAENGAEGIFSIVISLTIPLVLLIYSLVLYHKLGNWGQHNINAALIICAVMFMFGARMPFNSFGALLVFNIVYLLISGVYETIAHPRYY